MHGLVLFIMGLLISWNSAATNSPIFAEIVPEKKRTSIYALDRSFESVLASFAPPVVGILAQRIYGYKPIPKGSTDSTVIQTDRENAASLAKALYTSIGIPMAICCAIYSLLYYTYPRDRERAKMQGFIESEIQLMETDDDLLSTAGQEGLRLQFLGSDGQVADGRSVIDIKYGGNEGLNFDENDEKTLLPPQAPHSDSGNCE